jgi:LuxR family maltose regulon positive regulatory protein
LIEGEARGMIFAGRLSALRGWLVALPEEAFSADPRLAFHRLWIDILQSEADLSETAVQAKIEQLRALPPSPENDRLQAELMAVICRAMVMSGDTAGTIRLAPEALEILSEGDLASRARIHSALAAAYSLDGRMVDAEETCRQAVSEAVAAGDVRLAAHTLMVMGLTLGHYGRLNDAVAIFESIFHLADASPAAASERGRAAKIFYPAGQGHIGMAGVHLERNELAQAERHLDQGIALCRQGGLDGVFGGRMLLSRLRQARGDLEGATEAIDFPQSAFQRVDAFQVAARRVQIALMGGDGAGAARWAATLEKLATGEPARLPPLFREAIEAVLARFYLARHDVGPALRFLDRLEASARPAERVARLIEAQLLRGLAYQEQNDGRITSEAVDCLVCALQLAEPEGYLLVFLEGGRAVLPLLRAVAAQDTAPNRVRDYAVELLDALDASGASQAKPGESPGLVESLTPREMEVLALIAVGNSNHAIAEELVVTIRTVKKHASNIYGKLNVSSRTQAVARARELGLLPTDQ